MSVEECVLRLHLSTQKLGEKFGELILPSSLQLIRELGNINVKKKEPPFCYPYSLKARVLVLSHLARMEVSEELEEGRTQSKVEVTLSVLNMIKVTCILNKG